MSLIGYYEAESRRARKLAVAHPTQTQRLIDLSLYYQRQADQLRSKGRG